MNDQITQLYIFLESLKYFLILAVFDIFINK